MNESPNESMYRRIEGQRRGPMILLTLADGAIWNTRELAELMPPRGPKGALAMQRAYHLLDRYAQRGLVKKLPSIHEMRIIRRLRCRLRGSRIQTAALCRLLGIHRCTLFRMHDSGAFPQPASRGVKSSKEWNVEDVRQALQRGVHVMRKGSVLRWQITEEGMRMAKGERARDSQEGVA